VTPEIHRLVERFRAEVEHENYLTYEEMAAEIGISKTTFNQWLRHGVTPTKSHRRQLLAWLEARPSA
jgi:transcriptional regulator with XRE-family HTH domain